MLFCTNNQMAYSRSHESRDTRPYSNTSLNLQKEKERKQKRREQQFETKEKSEPKPIFSEPRKLSSSVQDAFSLEVRNVLGSANNFEEIVLNGGREQLYLGTSRSQTNSTPATPLIPEDSEPPLDQHYSKSYSSSHKRNSQSRSSNSSGHTYRNSSERQSNHISRSENRHSSKHYNSGQSSSIRNKHSNPPPSGANHNKSVSSSGYSSSSSKSGQPLTSTDTSFASHQDASVISEELNLPNASPLQLKMPERLSDRSRMSSVDSDMTGGVERIFEIMEVPPAPLTAIQTPITGQEDTFHFDKFTKRKLGTKDSDAASLIGNEKNGSDSESSDDSSDSSDEEENETTEAPGSKWLLDRSLLNEGSKSNQTNQSLEEPKKRESERVRSKQYLNQNAHKSSSSRGRDPNKKSRSTNHSSTSSHRSESSEKGSISSQRRSTSQINDPSESSNLDSKQYNKNSSYSSSNLSKNSQNVSKSSSNHASQLKAPKTLNNSPTNATLSSVSSGNGHKKNPHQFVAQKGIDNPHRNPVLCKQDPESDSENDDSDSNVENVTKVPKHSSKQKSVPTAHSDSELSSYQEDSSSSESEEEEAGSNWNLGNIVKRENLNTNHKYKESSSKFPTKEQHNLPGSYYSTNNDQGNTVKSKYDNKSNSDSRRTDIKHKPHKTSDHKNKSYAKTNNNKVQNMSPSSRSHSELTNHSTTSYNNVSERNSPKESNRNIENKRRKIEDDLRYGVSKPKIQKDVSKSTDINENNYPPLSLRIHCYLLNKDNKKRSPKSDYVMDERMSESNPTVDPSAKSSAFNPKTSPRVPTISTGSETDQPLRRANTVQLADADGSKVWPDSTSTSKRKHQTSDSNTQMYNNDRPNNLHQAKRRKQSPNRQQLSPESWQQKSKESHNSRSSETRSPNHNNRNQGERTPSNTHHHSSSRRTSPASNNTPKCQTNRTSATPGVAAIVPEPDSSWPEQQRLQTADQYMLEGIRLKHEGDDLADKRTGKTRHGEHYRRALSYFEAALCFIMTGYVMEIENNADRSETGSNHSSSTSHSPSNMYMQTIQLLDYVLKLMRPSADQVDTVFKRISTTCYRCQSVLHLRIFKLKKELALKYADILTEQFKASKSNRTPSPWHHTHTNHPTVLSPMSPAVPSPFGMSMVPGPSPAGVNNSGSEVSSSTQVMQPGKMTPTHNSVVIPQKTYDIFRQHHNITNNLLKAHEKWDQAEIYSEDHKDFFRNIDTLCSRTLTFHSSLRDVVIYNKVVLHQLRALSVDSPRDCHS